VGDVILDEFGRLPRNTVGQRHEPDGGYAALHYTNCADDAAVVLYTVREGGHSWPGGKPLPEWWAGPTSRSIDASSQLWTFFREHRLPRK
jgi:poly(3-hydroxybutyrate) depolymerase